MLKRCFDVLFALIAMLILIVPMVMIAMAVRLLSPGSAIYWSDRIGRENRVFKMPKFRTMQIDTPAMATHLMKNPDIYLTRLGKFLRKTSLDELPQLWSILVGDMSVVGPRPALFNQDDLVALRSDAGVQKLKPGLTGWAQVSGRDELPIPEKVRLDVEYLQKHSFRFDLKIILMTAFRAAGGKGVSH